MFGSSRLVLQLNCFCLQLYTIECWLPEEAYCWLMIVFQCFDPGIWGCILGVSCCRHLVSSLVGGSFASSQVWLQWRNDVQGKCGGCSHLSRTVVPVGGGSQRKGREGNWRRTRGTQSAPGGWVCEGIEVSWGEGLLQAGCNRTKNKYGEQDTKS